MMPSSVAGIVICLLPSPLQAVPAAFRSIPSGKDMIRQGSEPLTDSEPFGGIAIAVIAIITTGIFPQRRNNSARSNRAGARL